METVKVIKCRDKEEKTLKNPEAFSKAMLGPSVLPPGVQIAQSLPLPSCISCLASQNHQQDSPVPAAHPVPQGALPARGAQCPC